jgi:hypothetical protein
MKTILATLLIMATTCYGIHGIKTLGDTRWIETATTNDWSVSCYWMGQFDDTSAATNTHCIIALPASKYAANEAAMEVFIEALIDGDDAVDENTVSEWDTAMADSDLHMILTDSPIGSLHGLGLEPPEVEDLP